MAWCSVKKSTGTTLSFLQFLTSIIKLVALYLSNRKFGVSVEGEMSAPCEIQAGIPQGSVLSSTL
jgi:hypothetical protein